MMLCNCSVFPKSVYYATLCLTVAAHPTTQTIEKKQGYFNLMVFRDHLVYIIHEDQIYSMRRIVDLEVVKLSIEEYS